MRRSVRLVAGLVVVLGACVGRAPAVGKSVVFIEHASQTRTVLRGRPGGPARAAAHQPLL